MHALIIFLEHLFRRIPNWNGDAISQYLRIGIIRYGTKINRWKENHGPLTNLIPYQGVCGDPNFPSFMIDSCPVFGTKVIHNFWNQITVGSQLFMYEINKILTSTSKFSTYTSICDSPPEHHLKILITSQSPKSSSVFMTNNNNRKHRLDHAILFIKIVLVTILEDYSKSSEDDQ